MVTIDRSVRIVIRSADTRVYIYNYLLVDPFPPVIKVVVRKRGDARIEGRRESRGSVIIAEECLILFEGKRSDFIRFKYHNARYPKYANEAARAKISDYRQAILREAASLKAKDDVWGVWSYHYHLVVSRETTVKEFFQMFDIDKLGK